MSFVTTVRLKLEYRPVRTFGHGIDSGGTSSQGDDHTSVDPLSRWIVNRNQGSRMKHTYKDEKKKRNRMRGRKTKGNKETRKAYRHRNKATEGVGRAETGGVNRRGYKTNLKAKDGAGKKTKGGNVITEDGKNASKKRREK